MSLADIGMETLEVIEQGHYEVLSGKRVEIGPLVERAKANTRLYTPDELAVLSPGFSKVIPRLEVTTESTTAAGLRLLDEGEDDVCVLNFASARSVGGGFLRGARAQEEELCRGSALFRCLETQPVYYDANRAQKSAVYTDHLIYSREVPWIRDADRAFLDEVRLLSVITSPAPNTGAVKQHGKPGELPLLEAAFYRRAAHILAVAADQGHRNLVLGAWGCGAFQGDPVLAADAFGVALDGPFKGAFARVVFAILVARDKDSPNFDAFRMRFDPLVNR